MIWAQLDLFAAASVPAATAPDATAAPAPEEKPDPVLAAPATVGTLDQDLDRLIRKVYAGRASRGGYECLVETAERLLARYHKQPIAGIPVWADSARKAAARWRLQPGRGAMSKRLERLLKVADARTQSVEVGR